MLFVTTGEKANAFDGKRSTNAAEVTTIAAYAANIPVAFAIIFIVVKNSSATQYYCCCACVASKCNEEAKCKVL